MTLFVVIKQRKTTLDAPVRFIVGGSFGGVVLNMDLMEHLQRKVIQLTTKPATRTTTPSPTPQQMTTVRPTQTRRQRRRRQEQQEQEGQRTRRTTTTQTTVAATTVLPEWVRQGATTLHMPRKEHSDSRGFLKGRGAKTNDERIRHVLGFTGEVVVGWGFLTTRGLLR